MLCRPRESIRPGSLWKALGSVAWARCWRPLLAAKSLYSCSDVCVRVRRVKSRPFTVSVELQQWCVLSPLLFIVNISGSQLFRWREPNPDQRLCWRDSLTFFNTIQFTRFVLQQNEVCYTKYQTFYWKTAEGRTKGVWEPNAALRTGVENHWSTWIG